MRAIVQDEYGEADVLRLEEIERPMIGDDEVLLRVHAAAVDRARLAPDGRPAVSGPAGRRRVPCTQGPGPRTGGRRDRRGRRQERDHAAGRRRGVRYRRGLLRRVRPGQGATNSRRSRRTSPSSRRPPCPISALTALQAVRDIGDVQAGQQVLVIGASGGVGTFAVQIAKAFGAEVTGVCSTAKVDLVRSLGADRVIDYRTGDITDDGRRYDVIIDTGGNRSLAQLRERADAERHPGRGRCRDRRTVARRPGPATRGRWWSRHSSASDCGPCWRRKSVADLVVLADLVAVRQGDAR